MNTNGMGQGSRRRVAGTHRSRAEIVWPIVQHEIRNSKSETRNKSKARMPKNLKITTFRIFEIRIYDLLRISRFGFRTSSHEEIGNLLPRVSLAGQGRAAREGSLNIARQ